MSLLGLFDRECFERNLLRLNLLKRLLKFTDKNI